MTFGPVAPPNSCTFLLSSSPLPTISPVSTSDNCLAAAVLHYRVVTQGDQQADRETLAQVAAKIGSFNPNLTDFKPSLAVVATWKVIISANVGYNNVIPGHTTPCNFAHLQYSFVQTVLATDDNNVTFVLIMYEDPPSVAMLLSEDKLGFSSGNSSNQVSELEKVEEINLFRVDGKHIKFSPSCRTK